MSEASIPRATQTIAAVLADVDGILLTKSKALTPRAIEALGRLYDRGVLFAIASARPLRALRMLVHPLEMHGPMAAFNGGIIVLPNMTIVDEQVLPTDVTQAVIETMRARGLAVWIYRGAEWYVTDPHAPHVEREARTVQFEPTVVPSYDALLDRVVKIVGVSDDDDQVAWCEAAVQQTFGAQVSAARSQPYYLDVTHPTANNGAVIERLSRHYHIPLVRIATLGDQPNDVLMFLRSGLSIAMGNASEAVRRAATCVTASNEDEGFAKAIEEFILPRAIGAPHGGRGPGGEGTSMLLVGDIGGTKTDLALFSADRGPRAPIAQNRFSSGAYPSLEAIVSEFVADVSLPVTHACFAVAGAVISGRAALTNLPWVVEESALQAALGVEFVRLLNDVEAVAAAVPHLQPTDLRTLQAGEPVPSGAIAVIAAGTGIGEAFLTWDGARYRAHPSEGGHINFGPTTPRETELLRYLQARWGRVSYERVCAGRSIPDLYDFLKEEGRTPESPTLRRQLETVPNRTPPIVAAALDPHEPDPLCLAALDLFAANLGAEAGNLALAVLATGGVYIAGGMAQRVLPATGSWLFLSKFHDKGRLSPLLARMPVHLILEPVALLGAAVTAFEAISPPAGSAIA